MSARRILIGISVLVLSMLACQAVTAAVYTPTSPPTEEPTPIPTDTIPPTPLPPTEAASVPSQATPTPEIEHSPEIKSVTLRPQTNTDETTIYQDILFVDGKGDALSVDYQVVSASIEDVWVEKGTIDATPAQQKAGATVTGTWECGSDNYEVTLAVTVSDRASNKSDPYEYTVVCGLGAVTAGFPDLFDDNRNGWRLSDEISIQNGMLQFRNLPSGKARWVWCDVCKVNAEQSVVSVDASWSKVVEKALGLLVDHDTCSPDGLVFVIDPAGYYTIIQSVREADGTWGYWRPFMDWKKSSQIRRGNNVFNTISAEYEFGDDLRVTFFVNGARMTRVSVYGYNGSKECQPGLFGSSELDANFDNFNIAPPNP